MPTSSEQFLTQPSVLASRIHEAHAMNRRAFVTGLGAVLAAPIAVQAQQRGKGARIGWLSNLSPPSRAPIFEEALRDLGYIPGQNVVVDYRWAEGRTERLSDHAAELVRLKVDVIVAGGTPATQAAMQATTTIPIVMIGAGDPVGSRLVAELARPGGNVTGNTFMGAEVAAKRLQLLKEILPNSSRAAFLWNPSNASALPHFKQIQAAAEVLGLTVQSVEVRE